MKSQIELVGILHIVSSGIGILIGVGSFVLLSGIGWVSGDATAMGVLGIIGIVIAIFLGIISIPGLIAGIALLKMKPWARMLTIIVSCLDLFNVPFGTALGVYSLYVLMNDDAIRLLSGGPTEKVAVPTTA
ncbi:MAG: hypothetical protein H6Q30_128 [Bacteroidetes bacterium]|nr:hypothetical protein [Bacteroidota bacterium]